MARSKTKAKDKQQVKKNKAGGSLTRKIVLCVLAVMINVVGLNAMNRIGMPLYLDTVGTILAAALGGSLPGVLVGFVTNVINGLTGVQSVYYGVVNILVAVITALFARKGFFRDTVKPLAILPIYALMAGVISAVLTWFLNGSQIGGIGGRFAQSLSENAGLNPFVSQLVIDLVIEFIDKAITIVLVIVILRFLPSGLLDKFDEDRRRRYAVVEGADEKDKVKCRVMSLKIKIMAILVAAATLIAGASAAISFMVFERTTIEDQTRIAQGVTELAADAIDYNKVYKYITNGEDEPGYTHTENQLYKLKNSSPSIQYLYVYRILEDGCHVVFDLDTDEVKGSEPGEIIEFEDAFMPYVPALLAGEEIDPIISKDTYGWLLTVYKPVYDDAGKCRCYVAVDVSMNLLSAFGYSFLVKLVSLFASFLILTVLVTRWVINRSIVRPINAIAHCASAFAYNTTAARAESVNNLKSLNIKTGDEVENLYQSFVSTTEESMRYVAESKRKSRMIAEMQKGLIMVLADLVESRDKCTGDHVRKTAAYVEIITDEMKKRGFYADEMTAEFIQNVIDSAPLHDVGKIHIPDQILNKPGKLTDEEFDIMKTHTTVGGEIIDRVIGMVPESGYLTEARNLAEYHHEKWNGRGYPHGLSGTNIPLSARIMAVADVFDALVSRRSYKKPFSFEKAMSIIKEDAGTHFDPLVAEAFIGAADRVRAVAEEFDSMNGSLSNLGQNLTTSAPSEQARQAAEKAKQEELARQAAEKTQQEALARQAAEKAKQEELARQAAVNARQKEMARQAAEKAQQEALARQAAEEKAKQEALARQAAEKAKQEELARQAAEKVKQEELARQAAEKAKQEELARQAAQKKASQSDARRGVPSSSRTQSRANDMSIPTVTKTHSDQVIFSRVRHKK